MDYRSRTDRRAVALSWPTTARTVIVKVDPAGLMVGSRRYVKLPAGSTGVSASATRTSTTPARIPAVMCTVAPGVVVPLMENGAATSAPSCGAVTVRRTEPAVGVEAAGWGAGTGD